jgi:AcrR family transcriptional regulator
VATAPASHPTIDRPTGDDPRDRILAAAGREFAERGFEAATVRDICLAAGVNVAAVNYYFGEKRRLYIESVKHAHRERERQVPEPRWEPGTPPERKLRDFVGNLLERMLGFGQPDWQVRLMLRELLHPTERTGRGLHPAPLRRSRVDPPRAVCGQSRRAPAATRRPERRRPVLPLSGGR